MRSLVCFAVALAMSLSPAALSAPAGTGAPLRQKRLLEAGKTAFERLHKDNRRRRHRDAWEEVERELDLAVRAAPAGALAPESALWAARARAELYENSRMLGDVRAAVAAYRGVDEAYPDTPQGTRALIAGVQLGARAHEHAETALAARRLGARYPRSAEGKAALALVPAAKLAAPVAPAAPESERKPQRPVEVGDDADPDERTPGAESGSESEQASEKTPAASAIAAAIAKATAGSAAERGARVSKADALSGVGKPTAGARRFAIAQPTEASNWTATSTGTASSTGTAISTGTATAAQAIAGGAMGEETGTKDSAGSRDDERGDGSGRRPGAAARLDAQRPLSVAGRTDATAAQSKSTLKAEERVRAAPEEPDVDIPREAMHVVEEMVQAARKSGTAQGASGAQDFPAARVSKTAQGFASGQISEAAQMPGAAQIPGVARTPDAASLEAGADEEAPEPEAPEAPPQRTPTFVKLAKDAVARLLEPQDEPDAAAKARELRAVALAGSTSIAAQLGLKVRRVVIDPGHGGKDTGAIGRHGTREKDIALAIARRLASRLRGLGFKVLLTRNDDSFVALDERTRIANDAKADLFVSIHCNAARQRKLAGIETWTLNVASDRYAARLASFENADAERTVSDLRLILADLATKSNAGDARELAQSVQASLVRNLRSRVGKITDHGVKQALFYVLLGTHMPSILVETAFLSNPSEEARLRSAKYQEGAAEAIARGVKDFVDGRQRLALAP